LRSARSRAPWQLLSRLRRIDRGLGLAMALAAAVLLPRSYLISRAHNENIDADYHLRRGALFLKRNLGATELNDPPVGEAIDALPLAATGTLEGRWERSAIYGKALSPEAIVTLVAIWKSLLFLPMVGVVFAWCRRLYGSGAAALGVALLVVDPAFAAHIPSGAIDVLGTEGIVVACYLAWRYVDEPTYPRLLGSAVSTGLAMLIKHTAVILPIVVGLVALLWRLGRPERRRLRFPFLIWTAAAAFSIWTLTLFDFSRVDLPNRWVRAYPSMATLAECRWPAGVYARAFLGGLQHDREGNPAFLLGESRSNGWWYYFPVVATYKVPVGFAVVLLLGAASAFARRPRFDEWSLALPLLAWLVLLAVSRIDIGFRHFLPAYSFLLMLAVRCVALPGGAWKAGAWGGLAAAAVHTISFHPDYLSYVNVARKHVYLDISDSNLDWGEGLKQVRSWLDSHPLEGRPVYLRYFWRNPHGVQHYLGGRVTNLADDDPAPTSGILVISPVWVSGEYDREDRYAALRAIEPVDVIGHCMLVYDLDQSRHALGEASPSATR
jgi:hypothetical protein